MKCLISEEDILLFKSDIDKLDLVTYRDFVFTLSKFENEVLLTFLVLNYVYHFKIFQRVYFKFYKFIGK